MSMICDFSCRYFPWLLDRRQSHSPDGSIQIDDLSRRCQLRNATIISHECAIVNRVNLRHIHGQERIVLSSQELCLGARCAAKGTPSAACGAMRLRGCELKKAEPLTRKWSSA